MKKMLLGAVGLSALLASCGSGVAPDLSGSGNVSKVRTEYRLEGGQFVACKNYQNAAASTQVSVYFNVAGNVQNVNIGLRGNTTNKYDNNYNTSVSGDDLAAVGDGSYRLTFNANVATGGFLPQSIVVSPKQAKVKVVTASSKVGSFHADLSVDTGTATYDFNSRLVPGGNVDVYNTCTLVRTTDEDV